MRFSIIVPCYKCARYVRATLDSVLAQKSQDWEIICTDDGSPDETGCVLDDYLREHFNSVEEDARIVKAIGDEDRHADAPKRVLTGCRSSGARMTVVHQQNCGVSGARNTAMTLATGEWLVYLDGDDLLAPSALEIVEASIARYPNLDIVECGYVDFKDGESVCWGEGKRGEELLDVSKEIPSDPFGGCFQRFIFRRAVVKDVAYKGVSCTEELGYMVKCFLRARTLVRKSSVFYGYRLVVGSMSHRGVSLQFVLDDYDVTRHVTKILYSGGKILSSSKKRGLMNRWLERSFSHVILIELKKEREFAWQYWLEHLPKFFRYARFATRWQLFAIRLCVVTHSMLLAYLVGRIPHLLKRYGVHR